jgi:hypothetical protein
MIQEFDCTRHLLSTKKEWGVLEIYSAPQALSKT